LSASQLLLIAIAWSGAAIDQHRSRAALPTTEPRFSTGFPHASSGRRKLSTATQESLLEKVSPLDRRDHATQAHAATALHRMQIRCGAVSPVSRHLRQILESCF
jgi:hypothetical protein